jgi:hypothetical protein
MSDLEMQQYLFDLRGYLVIEDALSPEETATLNTLIDQQALPVPEKSRRIGSAAGKAPDCPGFLEWGKPFCDLLDHDRILPILRFRLGDSFRLDRLYGIQMSKGMSRGKLHADYGATADGSAAQPGEFYHLNDSSNPDGFVVVAWSLTDCGPDDGGFFCIPGSHKCNFKLPKEIADAPEGHPSLVIPRVPAGSVILFTEALTHGTAPWTGNHVRRTLLYKYCLSHITWSPHRVKAPSNSELTPRQQKLLADPADPYHFFGSLWEEWKG